MYGAGHKLIGKDYQTADLYAKVTGQAKYAEDYHADGMLFCKLLLSPLPHARVKHLDLRAALAMPGVKAILTADELPPPADSLTDNGTVIHANPKSELALSMEPLYQGEPILAVAAVDELTAAEAIEKIRIDFEPLPFVIDPLDTLRPGGPNPRTDGNIWVPSPTPAAAPGSPPPSPPPPTIGVLKWTAADFAAAKEGQLPTGKTPGEWSYGDVEAGFRNAALVLDETFVTPDTSHQTLETRSAMAYWQNGKVHVYTGTQSTAQTVPAIARWLNIDASKVVFVSEYTGGGFGSKITGGVSLVIPALLSKKANAPVMMRITREEETFIGRARPSLLGRMKVGFSKEGRIIALDMFVISNNGPYDANGDVPSSGRIVSLLYQPQAMRWRGATILTNTPPRSAQSSPGGLQGIIIIEPIIAKAARKLGVDQVAIRRINCPEGKAPFGPEAQGKRPYATSAFLKDALDRGAEQFKWSERVARTPKRIGSKVRGVGVSLSCYVGGTTGFDGILIIKPDGRVTFQSGIGNLGTEAVIDVHRVGAEILGVPWEKCDVVWGDSSKFLPFTCVIRRKPNHTRDDARRLRHGDGRTQKTAGDRREEFRRQARELRSCERARVSQRQRRGYDAGASCAASHSTRRHLRWPRSAPRRKQAHESISSGAGGTRPGGRRERQLPARRPDIFLRRKLRRSRSGRRNRQVFHRRFPRIRRRRLGPSSPRARRPSFGPVDSGHWARAWGRSGCTTRTTAQCSRGVSTTPSRPQFSMFPWTCNGAPSIFPIPKLQSAPAAWASRRSEAAAPRS